jgi:hypothetical protein
MAIESHVKRIHTDSYNHLRIRIRIIIYYYYYSSSISACSPRAGTDNIHVCC